MRRLILKGRGLEVCAKRYRHKKANGIVKKIWLDHFA